MLKNFIQKKLEKYVRKYFKKHTPKLILITGSVGKTTTKLAIATVLAQKYRVRVDQGNYNTAMSVPLTLLGIEYPTNIHSPLAWLRVRQAALQKIHSQVTDCDVIVQELGTDAPGDIAHFGSYLHADIAVVTAVSPEHMEFFSSLDAVAQEELFVSTFTERLFINGDDIASDFHQYVTGAVINSYGLGNENKYHLSLESQTASQSDGTLVTAEQDDVPVQLFVAGEAGLKAATAAGAVAAQLGLSVEAITAGLKKISSPPGRMRLLRGLKDSLIIDDSYNSSPLAAQRAIEFLLQQPADQRIVVFGDMNELGQSAAAEHERLGHLFDIDSVPWIATIGPLSRDYFGPAARAKGSQVRSFMDPYAAGAFVRSVVQSNSVILVKGSQNGVFSEEAVKELLYDPSDQAQLVRQSTAWLEKKSEQFDLKE